MKRYRVFLPDRAHSTLYGLLWLRRRRSERAHAAQMLCKAVSDCVLNAMRARSTAYAPVMLHAPTCVYPIDAPHTIRRAVHNRVCAVLCVRMAHSDASTPHIPTHTHRSYWVFLDSGRLHGRSCSAFYPALCAGVHVCVGSFIPFGLAYALRAALHGFIFRRLCAFHLYYIFSDFFFGYRVCFGRARVCGCVGEMHTLGMGCVHRRTALSMERVEDFGYKSPGEQRLIIIQTANLFCLAHLSPAACLSRVSKRSRIRYIFVTPYTHSASH